MSKHLAITTRRDINFENELAVLSQNSGKWEFLSYRVSSLISFSKSGYSSTSLFRLPAS